MSSWIFFATRLLFVVERLSSFLNPFDFDISSSLSTIKSHFFFLSIYSSVSLSKSAPIAWDDFITLITRSENTLFIHFTVFMITVSWLSNLLSVSMSKHFLRRRFTWSKLSYSTRWPCEKVSSKKSTITPESFIMIIEFIEELTSSFNHHFKIDLRPSCLDLRAATILWWSLRTSYILFSSSSMLIPEASQRKSSIFSSEANSEFGIS